VLFPLISLPLLTPLLHPPTRACERKPSRDANIAERRAKHNAVQRQTRDTQRLNGRFLDLAARLPNLSQIRRPFNPAVVNFSIAHMHASRHRRGSRELCILKLEADVLRRELNVWR
jgi:hypothetical protein